MNKLQITEYKNIRVLTTQQIAEAYGSDTRVISNNFNRNKDRYVVGYYYLNQVSSSAINNVSITESDFVLRIYGPVSKPLVKIGDNTYQVNVSLNAGERLEIDSRKRTVSLIHTDGYTENVLWSAAKEYYIFEKIVSGTQIIAWDGSFSFDLILIDKRSEPLWK